MSATGYRWWYVDALSDDGQHGLTLIGFVGSVFSPYYARARRRGTADPLDHCGLNVALYGRAGKRWALTERRRASLHREPGAIRLGPSSLAWEQDSLIVRIDETTVPLPSKIRGVVRVHPLGLSGHEVVLDPAARHRWWPIAPRARVEVDLASPRLRWSGDGYLDSNAGEEPIEQGFAAWDWSRATLRNGAAVLYDLVRRDGSGLSFGLRFSQAGEAEPFDPPPRAALPTTLWRVRRATRSEPDHPPRIVETLEDTPFYARSLITAGLLGERVTAVHESLSLDRFASAWVQMLLPFRMPRELR